MSAYERSGVDYGVLDAAKRRSLDAVAASLGAPKDRGASVVEASLGEPAQLLEVDGIVLSTVLECLGTKSVIAREVEEHLGLDCWEAIGVDLVAAAVNDLACPGALPLALGCYVATGDASFYEGGRHASFVKGFADACAKCGAAWVGGESPGLRDVVLPGAVDLAAFALGRLPSTAEPWGPERLAPGDRIVLLASSGLHTNGASLARSVAGSLEQGWHTPLASGALYGEAVLSPSVLYPPLVAALHEDGLGRAVHYASHLTGHGLRKLMRADRELCYRLHDLPPVPEVLEFVTASAAMGDREAYATFNMGAGFALYVEPGAARAVSSFATAAGYGATLAGEVTAGERAVVLEPLEITYRSEELALR